MLEHVDSPASVVWELPEQGLVFLGDFAPDRKTPSLRGGTSTSYLAALERMERELASYRLGHPGHGEPGPPAALLRATHAYIEALRTLVRESLEGDCALEPGEQARVKQALVSRFDHSFDTLLLPREHEANIEATARELGAGCVPATEPRRQPTPPTGS